MNEDWLRNGGSNDDMFVKLNEDEELAMCTQMLIDSEVDNVVANIIKKIIITYEKLYIVFDFWSCPYTHF